METLFARKILETSKYYQRGGNIDGDILYEKLLEKKIDTVGEKLKGGESKIERNVLCLEKKCVREEMLWKDTLERGCAEGKIM